MSNGIPITDPVELAWCEFARRRAGEWGAISTGEQGLSIASFKAGVRWERQRAREELRGAILGVFEQLVARAAPGQLHGIEGAVLDALDRIIPEER